MLTVSSAVWPAFVYFQIIVAVRKLSLCPLLLEGSPLGCALGLRTQSKPFFPLCASAFPFVDFSNVAHQCPRLGTVPRSLFSPARTRIHHDPGFDVTQPLLTVVQEVMIIPVQEAVILLHAMFPGLRYSHVDGILFKTH